MREEEGVLAASDGRQVGWLLRGPEDGRVVGWLHGQPGSRLDVRAFPDEVLERHGVALLAIDRAGYGATTPVGLDRRDVAADVLTVADALGVGSLPLMAVSMGGVYALTLAATAPDRIERVVLLSGHVLPYDDAEVVAALSESERADLALLRQGRTPLVEQEYAEAAASMAADPVGLLAELAAGWPSLERSLATSDWAERVGESVAYGLSAGHTGYLEDGLRTLRPLEVDLTAVVCPVRAVHGTADDLEPYLNLQRLAARVPGTAIVSLPGLGHFGPWLWPDLPFSLLRGA